MKKMKILTLLLCASLAFAYMGCSNSSGGSDSGTSTPSGNGGNSGGGQQGGGESINSTPYTKVGTQTINGVEYDIVTFGTFPQSEKTDNTINVDESNSNTVGSFTYYKGSDNEWYAKIEKNSQVSYYKVEPIKWRVLTENYDHDNNSSTPGKKLLLAENILINCKYYDYNYKYQNRTISSATIYHNNYEHSRIRAYLNGLSYQKKESDTASQVTDKTLVNKGFFQTAFTQAEQAAIVTTTVVNNAASTNPDGSAEEWNNGANQYASNTPTNDKIFLLSEQEVTKADYGFEAYSASGAGNTRIRMTTAFAKANGAYQSSTAGYGGFWWLRSPFYFGSDYARYVDNDGYYRCSYVDSDGHGIVPALCLN